MIFRWFLLNDREFALFLGQFMKSLSILRFGETCRMGLDCSRKWVHRLHR